MSQDMWMASPARKVQVKSWPIISPHNPIPVGGILLASSIIGSEVHYLRDGGERGRDYPCFGEGRCTICPKSSKWKGWIPILFDSGKKIGVLQLSDSCFRQLLEVCEDLDDLRGSSLWVARKAHRRNSEMVLHAYEHHAHREKAEAIKEIDVKPFLFKLWGIQELQVDATPSNPEQPRPTIHPDDNNSIPF